MKQTKFFIFSFVIMSMVACSKAYLDKEPLNNIISSNYYRSTTELRNATAALYSTPWFDYMGNPCFCIGDGMAGNLNNPYNAVRFFANLGIDGQNGTMITAWRAFYKVVAQSNATIEAIDMYAADSISTNAKNAAKAEARFMRATAYFHLVQLWGSVPIIERISTLKDSTILPRHKVEDVYQFIINDFMFAIQYLPKADVKGRVTQWSAKGMLSKVYLTRAGYKQNLTRNQADLDSAKLYAGDVCNNSGLKLLDNYHNLFRIQFNDNVESLFALQWVSSTLNGTGNPSQALLSSDGTISKVDGSSSFQPTYDLLQSYDFTLDTIRRKATIMINGDFYPEINVINGGYTYNGALGACKKWVVGSADDNGNNNVAANSTSSHNYMLRLADVYLVYVEAILGNNASTTDAEALKFFNLVRARAVPNNPDFLVSSIDADQLLKERRVELALEHQYWFDIIRLSYYNAAKALTMLDAQVRFLFNYSKATNTVTVNRSNLGTQADLSVFTFPYPSTEVTNNPYLLAPPVAYY